MSDIATVLSPSCPPPSSTLGPLLWVVRADWLGWSPGLVLLTLPLVCKRGDGGFFFVFFWCVFLSFFLSLISLLLSLNVNENITLGKD